MDIEEKPPTGSDPGEGYKVTPMQCHDSAETDSPQGLADLYEVAEQPIFVPYKLVPKENGKTDKVPNNGQHNLRYTEPSHRMPLVAAMTLVNEWHGLHGIGLVFEGGIILDGFQLVGLDYDDVYFDRFQLPVASYAERSPSGHGIHQLAWVPLAWAAQYRYTTDIQLADCHHAEVYLASRFLTATGDRINTLPINRLTADELLILESWKLKPFEGVPASAAAPEIEGGTAFDWTSLDLSPDQRHLIEGTGDIDRSNILMGLLIKAIDVRLARADILASMLATPALWGYCNDHRNNDEDKALAFAREEIGRAYGKSLTGKREALIGFNAGWATPVALRPPMLLKPKKTAGVAPLQAKHLVTDQANAVRLQTAVGGSVINAGGKWYVWNGTHWQENEPAAFRVTCTLSSMIDAEATDWENKPYTSNEERDRNKAIAEALRKWSTKSEMLDRLNAAFNLLRRLVSVPADNLDCDPYLLNVQNGTVDLRSGELRPHDRDELITHCIPIAYDPKADAPTFKRVLSEIAGGSKPLAEFLQRWFGYCATGVTIEQKFAVHHGDGANGKSLLLDTISNVLSSYAGTTAPGLLMAGGQNRHPAEVADLFGMRLAVAHESSESGVLNEDRIKHATGSDKMKARHMRQDFFEFSPTHTLNLLTNYKPQIIGQDMGIWRRVMLIPYGVTFGTVVEVEQGLAHHLRDDHLGEALKVEVVGILTWVVQGAVMWFMTGLRPPDIVLAAGAEYRSEQDRVGQFLTECCKSGSEEQAPCDATFDEYKQWALDCGYRPLSKMKFYDAVEKRPGITKGRGRIDWYGKARQCECFTGVRVIPKMIRWGL